MYDDAPWLIEGHEKTCTKICELLEKTTKNVLLNRKDYLNSPTPRFMEGLRRCLSTQTMVSEEIGCMLYLTDQTHILKAHKA
jgi:hypothetical protein